MGNVPGDLCVGESPGRPEKETYLSRQVCHCELFPQTEHMSLRWWGVSDGGATSVYLPFLRTLPSHLPTASVLDSVKPGVNGQRSQNPIKLSPQSIADLTVANGRTSEMWAKQSSKSGNPCTMAMNWYAAFWIWKFVIGVVIYCVRGLRRSVAECVWRTKILV